MKKIILILLVLICSKGNGSKGPALGLRSLSDTIINGFVIHGSPITSSGTFKLSVQDTIRVIMLCADTVQRIKGGCYWQYGYMIRRLHRKEEGFTINYDPSKDIIGYLDEDKKELSKDIIVWDSKQITQ